MILFAVIAIHTSWFQTWLAQQVSAYLSKELGTEVRIDKVDIVLIDELDLQGVYIEDIRKDTFLYTKSIHATIADWSLSESFVNVSNVSLNEGHIHIRKYKGDSTLNFQHIVDYFASDEPDTSTSNFRTIVQQIDLADIHFIYHDENSEPVAEGMDFSNIELKHLSGHFSDFGMDQGKININLKSLRFEERSGLKLTDLSTDFSYDTTAITMKRFRLGFLSTYLRAGVVQLKTPNGTSDWSDFMNKVRFKADFAGSKLYFNDLAYFVPALWGMGGHVDINQLEVSGPIWGMKLRNVDLAMLDTTRIKGNFDIPKLDDMENAYIKLKPELFRTSISDIKNMNIGVFLDEKGKEALHKNLEQFKSANIITLKNGLMDGYLTDFAVDGDLYTGIGNVHSEYGLRFTVDTLSGLYHYRGSQESSVSRDVVVENLNLGVITNNDIVGELTANLKIDGVGFDEKDLNISFKGDINKVGVYGYDYKKIKVKKGHFGKNRFTGKVDIKDDNLALDYDGYVDFRNDMYFKFNIKIDSAHLAELNNEKKEIFQRFASDISVDIEGTNLNKLKGSVKIENLDYYDGHIDFQMDLMTLNITRSEDIDSILLRSPYVDLDLIGKYDLLDVGHAVIEQFSYIVDNVVEAPDKYAQSDEFYSLWVNLKDVNSILQFYDPDIYVESNTIIKSEFNHKEKSFALDVNCNFVDYHGMEFEEIKIENHFDSVKANIFYQTDYIKLSDSLEVRNVYFDSRVKDNKFLTNLGWDGIGKMEPALFAFESEIAESMDILTNFRPSFFFLKGHQYNVNPDSKFLWNPENMIFEEFTISHEDQYIKLDGNVSKNPDDWLKLTVKDFDLSDLNGLIGTELDIQGIANINGRIAGVYDKIKFEAQSNITELVLNQEKVGDIYVESKWDATNEKVSLVGDLKRDNMKTFTFSGGYYTARKKDNIDLKARFDKTDIAFLNAFEDPELYTDIAGNLDGSLHVGGELDNPIITGKMEILNARVKVPMLNVYFGAAGVLKFNDGEIIANHLSIIDQESNVADCQMQIYHYDWADWNYNIMLDMDNPALTKKFLAMDSKFQEGDYYYGKAYVTGYVDVFGFDGHTEIDVDVKTHKGTDLVLPMYGDVEIEENSFVIFDESFFLPDSLKNDDINSNLQNVERLGMTLTMKFNVTPEAKVTIVFDPLTGDQIIAKGNSDLEIKMDDFGDLTMRGKYTVDNGVYEMRIKGLVEEDFTLVKGGTVEWTGSPYDALINLNAQFYRNVSLNDIMPPDAGGGKKKDDVYGNLLMGNTLMAPELTFDITSPTANEFGKKALAELKTNPDELNKQFFSLLVLKRFIPIYGGGAGGENVVLGLAETQINSILGGLSESYDLKAGLSDGETTIGVETKLNDRITVSTSFGVLNPEDGETTAGGGIVGDVDVEYRLNEDGTFTMNFFNETNEASITAQGHFTQGISLHYQETFNTTKEFKALQKFLNIFRRKDKKIKFEKENRRSNKWVPLPEEEPKVEGE